jgi:hypothetical protein
MIKKIINYDRPRILVYQMGKVGSSSIFYSLKKKRLRGVYHVHRLNIENIKKIRHTNTHPLFKEPTKTGEELCPIFSVKPNKIKIITMTRDPIARNISAFFENLNIFEYHDSYQEKVSIDGLNNLFLDNYSHDIPLNWFDIEIKNVLEIDVFKHYFCKSKGHSIINNKNIELLIIKCEIDNEIKTQVIKRFLNLRKFKLINANIGTQKKYSNYYQKFKDSIKLPREYINKMYDSKYSQHFYSGEEIVNFKKKWSL